MSRTERIHAIDDFIKRYGKVTKQRLVDYLEVSKESIKKDIAYMRDFLRAPIEYDSKIRGYIYTKPYEYLSFASEETILFHVFMKALAEDLEEKGMNYIPVVPKDILKDLSQNIREEYLSVMDQIEYHSSAIEQMDRKLILSIIQAMRHKNKLKVHYTNAKGEESDRELEPYKLLNYQGNWYVIAYCSQRESLATFLVARIDKLAVLDAKFDSLTESRDVKQFIESSTGMYKSEKPILATVRFYEPVLYKVNHQIWHKEQKTENGEIDGKKFIDFTVPVGWSFEEIMAKVMAYAPHSEVISPPEFRDEWKDVIEQLYAKYIKLK